MSGDPWVKGDRARLPDGDIVVLDEVSGIDDCLPDHLPLWYVVGRQFPVALGQAERVGADDE